MKIIRNLRKDWSEETRAKAFLEKTLEGIIFLDDNDQPIFDDDKKEDLNIADWLSDQYGYCVKSFCIHM